MKKILIYSILMLTVILQNAAAMNLELGKTGDSLAVITANDVPENFGRGLPMGPASLRFLKGNLWVSDSIPGNFVEFDQTGKMLRKIVVPKGTRYVFHDFALQTGKDGNVEAIWTIGSEETNVLQITPDGKVKTEFATGLSMPIQLELLSDGSIAIFDEGEMKIIAFDKTGKQLWQQETAGKKFLVNNDGEIIFLKKAGEEISVCKRSAKAQKTEVIRTFPVSADSFPQLESLEEDQSIIFSFHSTSEEDEGLKFMLARLKLDKSEMDNLEIVFPAAFLKRFYLQNDKQAYLVKYVDKDGKISLQIEEFDFETSLDKSEG
jgi:hypothetical protein